MFSILQVHVKYRSDVVTEISDSPALSFEGLIGNLGGTLNLWIGISLTTIIELFDLLYHICEFYYSRRHHDRVVNVDRKPGNDEKNIS